MANLLDQKVKFLRNKFPFGNYEVALSTIKSKLQELTDGEIVLASYLKTEGEGEQAQTTVRTLLGIRRDFQDPEHPGYGDKVGYEIFDNEAANDAIKALDANMTGGDNHVTVNVVQIDGKVESVTVTTNDIASAALLGQPTDTSGKNTAFGKIKAEETARIAAINALDATVSSDTTNVNVSIKETNGVLTNITVSEDYAEVTRTQTSSSEAIPKEDATLTVRTGDDEKLVKASDLNDVACYAADKVKEETDARKKAIADLDVAQIGDGTTYIKSVSETDGKIAATTGTLNTDAVAFVRTEGSHTALASATTTTQALDALEDAIEANKAAELTYEVDKLTEDEITALSDANVKEAYKVVSVTTTGTKTQVGQTIKIYKDSSLKEAEFVTSKPGGQEGEVITGQFLKLVYIKADGREETVYIDMSQLIIETEVENGIQAVNHKLSIKLDQTGDGKFLTVGENGLKLDGVSDAINDAITNLSVSAQGDAYVDAAVDASNNKKIKVSANVKNVTGTKGTVGSYDTEGAQTTAPTHGTLTGVANALVDSAQSMAKVKDYVDGEVAIEAARADAKVLSEIKALDKDDNAVAKSFVTAVSESDGIITVSRGTVESANNTVVIGSKVDGGINLGVNVDDASIKISNVDGHVGQLTVGTIDCGTY